MKRLQLATGNAKKVTEIRALLEPLGFTVVAAPAGFAVDEDQETFAGNALKKAQALFEQTGLVCMADDSGLAVAALGGAPGVHSARYAGVDGPEQDAANRKKLLQALQDVPEAQRGARFVCAIALVGPQMQSQVFTGEVCGRITHSETGTAGFGYDPLFVPEHHAETFAQMSLAQKQSISHRGKALRQLVAFLSV